MCSGYRIKLSTFNFKAECVSNVGPKRRVSKGFSVCVIARERAKDREKVEEEAMADVIELTDRDFQKAIQTGVVLVDFWAPWCGPCMMQGPICEQVAAKVKDRAKVAKVNVDEGPETAAKYGIRSIPTLIIFKDGEAVQQFVGVRQESELLAAIEQAL